jgi:hypothetical protein
VPLVTQHYPEGVGNRIGQAASAAGALWLPRGRQMGCDCLPAAATL